MLTRVVGLAVFLFGSTSGWLFEPRVAPTTLRLPQRSDSAAVIAPLCMVDIAHNPEKAGLSDLSGSRAEGTHGTGYRFMATSTMPKGDSGPALLCIAGAYPGLTSDQLLAPSPLPFAPKGMWNYHVLTGDTCATGFVALPGSPLLDAHPDTVAVVCASGSLGIEFPDGNEHEVLALIDRSDIATTDQAAFDDKTVYAFADEKEVVHIRWVAAIPAGWRVLGRLLYAQMPVVKRPNEGGGFAEMSDEFEF